MLTGRGWAAVAAGLSLFVAGRLIGSVELHMLAAGILVLPLLAWVWVRWSRSPVEVARHLSAVRVFPGAHVTVSLTLENQGRTTTSFLLLEDQVPASLGKPARLVVAGIPPRCSQTVRYRLTCRTRGRYHVGPLTVFVSDPFGLARTRLQTSTTSELVVYPEVEDINTSGLVLQGAGAGEAAVRHLHRSANEFYTMREYVTGDDLRRIHWPSVARTGHLMIRQDESTRKSTATVLLDTRASILGANGSPGFEKAISAAATLGRALIRSGFTIRLATVDVPARPVEEDGLLETLAAATPSRTLGIHQTLSGLRGSGPADTTLVVVSAPPLPSELAFLSRVASSFGRKLGVFVYPTPVASLAVDAAAELEGRASAARASLQRAGWDVVVVHAEGRLADVWQANRTRKLRAVGSSF